ncbi:MAG: alpha/beta hydrolase [Acidimicrobiia bacterium]|nr:alpha/beta hydrolase [Acidimicrobiia bacterium]
MAIVEANGINICYEDTGGDGEPLLLVMGLGGQLVDWSDDFVATLVARGFRVIRHDNRDIGLSTEFDWEVPNRRRLMAGIMAKRPIEVGYRIADMAADAASLLDVIGVGSAHVVGASMGGMIAQTMAFEHPATVRSLTSIMSNTGDRRNGGIHPSILAKVVRMPRPSRDEAAEVGAEMYSLWAGSSWDREEHLASARRSIERSWRPAGVDRQTAAIAGSPDRTPMLGTITAPTLVIHGLEDKLVVPSGGTATAKAIPGSRLLMFPDMGHDIPRTRWHEVANAIAVNARRAGASSVAPLATEPV